MELSNSQTYALVDAATIMTGSVGLLCYDCSFPMLKTDSNLYDTELEPIQCF